MKKTYPSIETMIPAWKCKRCGYAWPKRSDTPPLKCSRCRSYYWQRPKKIKPTPHIPNPAEEYKPNV